MNRNSFPAWREVCDLLIQHIPVMIASFDSDGKITSVSQDWLDNLGYCAEEVIGRGLTDFMTEASRRSAAESIFPVLAEVGTIKNHPIQFFRKNHEIMEARFSAIAEKESGGRLPCSLAVLNDVSGQRRAEERIREQNAFLKTVIESLPHPFYVLDASDYRIKMANSATGVGRPGLETTCYAMTHRSTAPCNGSEHVCPMELIKSSGKPARVEHVHYDPDGNLKNVEVYAYPIFDDDGKVAQIIEYALDITERKRMEDTLRINAEKIKHFAYSVSHDLRSPLVGIHGLARLLRERYGEKLDARGKEYCERIVKACGQIMALVEEINAYIRAKESPLRFEEIDPNEILRTVRDEFCETLSTRQIRWSQPRNAPIIKADRMGILRIFRNLVDNALKYGGEGLSEIDIVYTGSHGLHTFCVHDDGIGIQSEDCEKVFGAFQRNATSQGIEGTGLGLAIVREIASKHHGEVWAKPGAPRGAVFCISFSKAL